MTRQICHIVKGSAARFDVYLLPKIICSKQKQEIKPFPHHDLSLSKCPKQKQAHSRNIKNCIVVKMICFDSALQSTISTHPTNNCIILIGMCLYMCVYFFIDFFYLLAKNVVLAGVKVLRKVLCIDRKQPTYLLLCQQLH